MSRPKRFFLLAIGLFIQSAIVDAFSPTLIKPLLLQRKPSSWTTNTIATTTAAATTTTTVSRTPWNVLATPRTASSIGRPNQQSSSSLQAVSPAVASAAGHVIGSSLAVFYVVGAIRTWFSNLSLPKWTPPNALVVPTWIVLYSTIGVAASRIAAAQGTWKSYTLMCWGAHYVLNMCWAPVFFGLGKTKLAFTINGMLLLAMPYLVYLYAAVDRVAAAMLVPYTAWISCVMVMNWAIGELNLMEKKEAKEAKKQWGVAKKMKKEATDKVEDVAGAIGDSVNSDD